MEEEADYHDIAPETEYYQDYQDLLRRRTGGERAADDEAKMGAVELSIQKLQANLEGPLREYSDAKLQAYLDAHFDLSIWLVLRKRQWVSHRYGLFRRRLEKKEKEQREELRRKAMEWNAGLRAACVPWTPNEVFRSRDFASRVHDRARELEEFDEEEKAGEPPGYRRSMQIYPRAPAEVRRSLEERERKGTDGAWAPRKRLAKAQAAGSFEEAAMCEVRDGFLLNPPDQFRWDFTDLVARYARMKHAISRILAAYDEEDRRRQMACDCGRCIRSGYSDFSARARDCDVRREVRRVPS
jgi:hypothetical protein